MKHLMRSLLFVPGHNEKYLNKAVSSQADVLLIDIEDSCQPHKNKAVARSLINRYLSENKFIGKSIYPRINERESGEMLKDLLELAKPGISGFMYPKATCGEDIYFFGKLLGVIEKENKLEHNSLKIIALVETAGSVFNLQEMIDACPNRMVALAFGHLDYLTDIKAEQTEDASNFNVARTLCAIAARSRGIIPIDTIHPEDVYNADKLSVRLKKGKELGYEGMLCLNPVEIDAVNKNYSPSEQEISWAIEVLESFEEAKRDEKGVALVRGKFVGPPLVKKAQELLDRATKANLL
jgi:citrate lyase subunit beta/citryl-CoA lyase